MLEPNSRSESYDQGFFDWYRRGRNAPRKRDLLRDGEVCVDGSGRKGRLEMSRRRINLERETFREDRVFVEQIRRQAYSFRFTQGAKLFGSFGERNAEDSFTTALEIGYYAGMMSMYRFFIREGNDALLSGKYDAQG